MMNLWCDIEILNLKLSDVVFKEFGIIVHPSIITLIYGLPHLFLL